MCQQTHLITGMSGFSDLTLLTNLVDLCPHVLVEHRPGRNPELFFVMKTDYGGITGPTTHSVRLTKSCNSSIFLT